MPDIPFLWAMLAIVLIVALVEIAPPIGWGLALLAVMGMIAKAF